MKKYLLKTSYSIFGSSLLLYFFVSWWFHGVFNHSYEGIGINYKIQSFVDSSSTYLSLFWFASFINFLSQRNKNYNYLQINLIFIPLVFIAQLTSLIFDYITSKNQTLNFFNNIVIFNIYLSLLITFITYSYFFNKTNV